MKLYGKLGMAGVSFVETMAAIFIVFVLAAIAMPHFTRVLPGIRLNSAARQIATDLQLARMRAISRHTNQTVTFDPDTATYAFGTDTRNLGQLYPGTTFTTSGNPTFTATGTANAITITISNNSVTKTVQVNALGRVVIP